MRQLPLGVRLHDRALFASFLPGPNAAALAAAQALAARAGAGGGPPAASAAAGQPVPTLIYLHGIQTAGKSHLLQAVCAQVAGSAYLPLAQLHSLGPEALEGLSALPLLAIDDVEAVAGRPDWEHRLFSLYNECMEAGCCLAVAGSVPAPQLPLHLADLRSRLAAMPHYAVRPLDEVQQREALKARAAARGMELPEDTLQYLQRRLGRDMGSLYAMLERLDAASLAAQRPLTVPFVREILERGE